MPLSVGAVLGGADDKILKTVEKFGYYVGLAFQLRDDVLGVFGDSEETGKSNESDILEGKKVFCTLRRWNWGVHLIKSF